MGIFVNNYRLNVHPFNLWTKVVLTSNFRAYFEIDPKININGSKFH